MLKSDIEAFREKLSAQDKASIIEIAVENYSLRLEMEARLRVQEDVSKDMSQKYNGMRIRLNNAEKELEELRKQNRHLLGVKAVQDQEMYGVSSEKFSNIFKISKSDDEYEDPLSEDDFESTGNKAKKASSSFELISFKDVSARKRNNKRKAIDTSSLPEKVSYEYDINAFNEQFGEGNWRFFSWERHETIKVQRRSVYLQATYTPVISYGLEHMLYRAPYEGRILPKSKASSDLLAGIFCDYGNMHLPVYRIEQDDCRYGISLSRQTITRWIINASRDLLSPVVAKMKEHLDKCLYHQGDETTYRAIADNTHLKNYIWVNRTSELANTEQVILYTFEVSRSAGHLYGFYTNRNEKLFLTSDAYGAYRSLELTNPDQIYICGCFMHARRRFVDAIKALRTQDSTLLSEYPATIAIKIIMEMYSLESELKNLSANDRLVKRQELLKPVVDKYFDYLNTLDENNPTYSDKLKDAISYSKNQEAYLRRFLADGNIPIDNGASERSIKPIACHRKNSLFSYSIEGAESTMTLMSIIETAKENGAVPYYYLKYLLERMSKVVYYGHSCDMEEMMPWSVEYKQYEVTEKELIKSSGVLPGNERPETPKKKRTLKERTA